MADNVNPDQKQPGEHQEGKFHYNPGNQAGKTVEVGKPEGEQINNKDRIEQREEPQSR
ncbi:hypothetical protein HL667_22390 [Bradyrhizobium sp. 83012]|uniref:Uncharacterized protein n=1 Tax=Bradyrhizobium aeschynomenes TaxID=2734909 RepID=A0ABX2CJ41_9BRAD|nr:hypothetical protein [Bradyrhizobium aeschynomenes]NPU67770.1 hypothetical protein [Bradyrhizobium aeschynomenes]NPV23932.1 hypothetical protein [Bradyrhizobium aeschynomenes]